MSSDDAFTLSTMVISDDDNTHEIDQEEQIQQIAKQERQIREAKKRKQAQRRKWFRMLLLFHRRNVLKESKRFEKHKENLINQCIGLTSRTFMSKNIFNQTDISIASKGIPSILPIRVLKNRPQFIVNTAKKINRSANNAAYSLDIKSALSSLWPQALDTLSPVLNLGISIAPNPNKLDNANDAAPGAALNMLPVVPPYTPKQAVSPLLRFVPVDFELRREKRPYSAAAKAAEALFDEKFSQGRKKNSHALFFLGNGLDLIRKNVADEFEELRNLEFAYHENDDDNIDEDYSSNDEDETPQVKPRSRITENKKIDRNISKPKVKKSDTKKSEDEEFGQNDYYDSLEENAPYSDEYESERHNYSEEEEEEEEFVFDTRELKNIINFKCLEFIDFVTYDTVARGCVNKNMIESTFVTKPLNKFADYFAKEVLPLYPERALDNYEFNFLNEAMDKSLDKFLKDLLLPAEMIAKKDQQKTPRNDKSKRKHKKHHRHHKSKEKNSNFVDDQSDGEAMNQVEA